MDRVDLAIAAVAAVALSVLLHGFWSVALNGQLCGGLTGFMALASLAGVALAFSARSRQLEPWGVLLALLYAASMLALFFISEQAQANPGSPLAQQFAWLQYC